MNGLKLIWRFLYANRPDVEDFAWMSSAGDVLTLPDVGDAIRSSDFDGVYRVLAKRWHYDDGITKPPTRVVIELG